jgi:hypothetical protein
MAEIKTPPSGFFFKGQFLHLVLLAVLLLAFHLLVCESGWGKQENVVTGQTPLPTAFRVG